jgi:hypothetical protein
LRLNTFIITGKELNPMDEKCAEYSLEEYRVKTGETRKHSETKNVYCITRK